MWKTRHLNLHFLTKEYLYLCCHLLVVNKIYTTDRGWEVIGTWLMVWVWIRKISPKNVKFFFPFGPKKISSSWVKKYPGQRRVGPLIYCRSKVSSGQGPSLALRVIVIFSDHRLLWRDSYKDVDHAFTAQGYYYYYPSKAKLVVFLFRDHGKMGWRHVSVCHFFFRPYRWS